MSRALRNVSNREKLDSWDENLKKKKEEKNIIIVKSGLIKGINCTTPKKH